MKVMKKFNKFLAGDIDMEGKTTKTKVEMITTETIDVLQTQFLIVREVLSQFCTEAGYTFPEAKGIIFSKSR